MSFFKLASIFSIMAAIPACAALPTTEVAAPTSLGTPHVLDVISATMWTEENWTGSSIAFSITTQSQCYALDGGAWTNIISSIQVPAGYRCRFWDSNSCNGDSSADIYSPGAYTLGSMDNKATSFKCYVN
ncbi:unnamed protein product [Discula destructiva]